MSVEREPDELGEAFRAIARGDAEDAQRRAAATEAALLTAFRASRPPQPRALRSQVAGLALAASLAAAVLAGIWVVVQRPSQGGLTASDAPPAEIVTAFMPLVYSAVPFTDGRLVRIDVPRAALGAFGLAPLDALPNGRADINRTDTILADVVVGEDGLARAVRFVRAPRAPGVAP